MERLSYFWPEALGAANAQGGAGVFTGGTRGPGPGLAAFDNQSGTPSAGQGVSGVNYFKAVVLADQTGTATIDLSNDGTNWWAGTSGSIVANTPLQLSTPAIAAFFRVHVINGATPQTFLWANTAMTGA